MEKLSRAAALDRPILVIGERGTGKELAASRAHFLSPRWRRPYVKVNCAALTESLLESELFGHEAGAFTGAARRHIGRFERADGGTLFLDEIASAGLPVQEKILRVIEYGEYERVGGSEVLTADVRVVAAANVDLPEQARRGRFRADLLDRLAFEVVTLPPLRARWEDIPVLAQHFAHRMIAELGHDHFAGFSAEAMHAMMAHDWPGNVRELKNAVERSVYRAGLAAVTQPLERVDVDPFASPWRPVADADSAAATESAPDPAAPVLPPPGPCDFKGLTSDYEKLLLARALRNAAGHQGKAASSLSLTYHQFRNLLRKHGLTLHA
jgi:psp operon transcriptional activator